MNAHPLYAEATARAKKYAELWDLSIEAQLGGGIQGVVVSTKSGTAIKAFRDRESYERERNVYLRLTELALDSVDGFSIPALVSFDDAMMIVEMQIVRPPFVVDFASAYLDEQPPYANDRRIMREWEAEKREQFEDRWPEVKSLLSSFRALGIYLADVKPGNIEFAE